MLRSSTLEYALIGLLQQRAQSGYDLRKTFASTAMRHYSDSPGSIYPALRRLEARGWIAAESLPVGQAEDPRKRQAFHLTETGRAALVAWVEQRVTAADTRMHAHELMLRFAFMDGNVPRSTAIRFLEEFETGLAIYVEELRTQLEQMRTLVSIHTGILAFESGIEGMEVQLDWARRARAQLAGADSRETPPCLPTD